MDKTYTDTQHVEMMTLSKALKFPEARKELKIEPQHFENPYYREIYKRLISDDSITDAGLLNEAVKHPDLYGGYELVMEVTDYPVPSKHGILNDQEQVYAHYAERERKRLTTEYLDNPNEVTEITLRRGLQDLHDYVIDDHDSKHETLVEIMGEVNGEGGTATYKTGFESLDQIIEGFEMQQLNLIAARPSLGKTALGLNLSCNLEGLGAQVIFISLETTEKNITRRLLASLARVELGKFSDPSRYMTSDEGDRVINAIDRYYKMDLRVVEAGRLTPSDLNKIINTLDKDRPAFIFIDYLTLMRADKNYKSKYEEVTEISRELKMMTQSNKNLSIIALAQLNRSVEQRQDKRPMMSDLRDSGQIEQDSNLIMMLYSDEYQEEQANPDKSDIEVIVRKNKDGGIGTAELEFFKKIQKFY